MPERASAYSHVAQADAILAAEFDQGDGPRRVTLWLLDQARRAGGSVERHFRVKVPEGPRDYVRAGLVEAAAEMLDTAESQYLDYPMAAISRECAARLRSWVEEHGEPESARRYAAQVRISRRLSDRAHLNIMMGVAIFIILPVLILLNFPPDSRREQTIRAAAEGAGVTITGEERISFAEGLARRCPEQRRVDNQYTAEGARDGMAVEVTLCYVKGSRWGAEPYAYVLEIRPL